MSTPSIKVGQGNWGIKAGNLLAYANTEKKFAPVEFTSLRALNTATRVNPSGNIEIVNADIPRIDYFGGQASLLVEPSAINLSLNSNSFSVETAPVATVVQNQVDIFGNPDSAWLMSGADSSTDAANANNVRRITPGFTSGSTYAGSIYIKSPTGAPVTFRYRQATVITSTVASGDGWFRAVNISTLSSTSYRAIFYTDDGAPIIMCHSQAELGTVPTSYIGPVAGTALTRNADVVSVTGVAGLIGQTEGTLYAEVDIRNAAIGSILTIDDGDTTDFISIIKNSNLPIRARIRRAGGTIVNIITSTAVSLGVHKIALGYTNGDYALYIDGVSAGTSTNSTDYPATALTRCVLSNTDYGPFNDRILAASIYQTRLPNTTTDGSPSLQSITTL